MVLEAGETLPIIGYLALLLIKVKSKMEDLEKTAGDTKQVVFWADRT